MSVQFVIGRAGSGKTQRTFDAIVKLLRDDPLGPPVFWLLPRQATFTAERRLTCESGLHAFSRARVLSFDQLGREILAECGGVTIPQITPLGRQMILSHLLRVNRGALKFFQSVAHQGGLAAELNATFAELERCGQNQPDLSEIVEKFEAEKDPSIDDAALRDKLHDLQLLYSAYTRYLSQDRLDPHRRYEQIFARIDQCKKVRGATIFVDGFYEFDHDERRFLVALAASVARLEINLTLDPANPVLRDPHHRGDELSTFHLTEETYRRLWFAFECESIAVDSPIMLREAKRFSSAAVAHVEHSLFLERAKKIDDSAGIELIEAPDQRGEIDAVARWILMRLATKQFRPRDVLVVARDLDGYHELVDASFTEHGLPHFIDRRRGGVHHPLIQLTRALIEASLREFDHDAMMTLIKSGLISLIAGESSAYEIAQGDAADRLENFVLRHRVRGNAWSASEPWAFHRKLLRREDDEDAFANLENESAEIDAMRRRLIEPMRPFVRALSAAGVTPAPLRQLVQALLDYYESIAARQTLSRWIDRALRANELEQAAEHEQVWQQLCELLEQMTDLLGDENVSATDFSEILGAGLETFDLALAPPTVDQILVGSVDRTRPQNVRAVIVLGMNEGSFPKCPSENSIFCDADRRRLDRRKIRLDAETQRRLFDERFLAYVTFTRAGETLCLSRPLADGRGRRLAPSTYWTEVSGLFSNLKPRVVDPSNESSIGTPRQLVTCLLRWTRDRAAAEQSEHAALYSLLRAASGERVAALRDRAWPALRYRNDARLSEQSAEQFFGQTLNASVSRIETFATCPFKHFAQSELKLAEREDEQVTAIDLGNVYHGILENVIREIIRQREDLASVSKSFTDAQIKKFAREIGQSLREEVLLGSARNQYILDHIQRTLDEVIERQQAVARRGKFRPWKTELTFGLGGVGPDALPPFELLTPQRRRVRLHGKIDRVDLLEDRAAFAVIDYKLRGSKLALNDVYHGLSLQLLTYLLVLENSADKLAKKKLAPAAAFYVRLLRKLESVDHPADARDPQGDDFQLAEKPRGIFDEQFISALDENFQTGDSKVVQYFLKKDGGLGVKSDALAHDAFAAMLDLVRRRIGELADQIINGNIAVAPYRIGTTTPCGWCPYRSVCRFDPIDGYRTLAKIKPAQVLEEAMRSDRDE